VSRPARLVLVAGTGTGVGKTWLAARLLTDLRAGGTTTAARKPAQSFDPGPEPTDADVLAGASGEAPTTVCPAHRWYERAMAPFMAAEVLGRPPPLLEELVAELAWPEPGVDVGIVESAGGARSPITADGGDTVDLALRLDPDLVVLVADAGLGTINAVRLCLAALAGLPTAVVLNRFDTGDDLHRRNRAWLADHAAAPVLAGVPDLIELVLPG
jgi:dethiobiotin synthetase